METKKQLYLFGFLLFLMTSCDLTKDLEDYKPLYQIEAETAIKDENSAELNLTGIYAALRLQRGINIAGNPELSIIPCKMSITATNGRSIAGNSLESLGYVKNNPLTYGPALEGGYTILYTLINRANWVIEGVEKLKDSDFKTPARRQEIIGEAKTLRALGHFYLLRLWGQFYDTNSAFGINVRLTPARSNQAFPRNTVSETYIAILNDLDDAIIIAPNLRKKYFANKTFAKGLKAKVLLYKGDYAQAASLAKDVIDNSGPNFALTPTFMELFDHTTINTLDNTEGLFCLYSNATEFIGGNAWGNVYAALSEQYRDLALTGFMMVGSQKIIYDGPRMTFVAPVAGEGFNYKFALNFESYETLYHLRMAEMYLIYAEAIARSTNAVSPDALAALNAIRIRAGATTTGADGFETYPATITLKSFLEAVRIEKMMELGGETGETWFDLVRYDYVDGFGTGFQVSDVKATATNKNKFILPIPTVSINAGNGVVIQNPGY